MTRVPLCQHLETKPISLVGGYRRTRCVECGAEFAKIEDPYGQSGRTLRRYQQFAREREARLSITREAMFKP